MDRSRLPPVHQWEPECVKDIGMRIARDGAWYYQGSSIDRDSMVRLFSTLLRRDGDEYFLVTPVEKITVDVDLVPFLATESETSLENGGSVVAFRTNVGDIIVVDRDHPVWVEEDSRGPLPFVRVRDRLDALMTRSVFYELAVGGTLREIDGRQMIGFVSRGSFYVLGPAED